MLPHTLGQEECVSTDKEFFPCTLGNALIKQSRAIPTMKRQAR